MNRRHTTSVGLSGATTDLRRTHPSSGIGSTSTPLAVSLFTGGGIGDLALRACGAHVLAGSELLPDRASVYRANYPETRTFVGDIRETKREIVKTTKDLLRDAELDILFATPPCQGMSRNGRGKLLSGIRAGIKPALDPRNTLALEAVDIALALNPKVIVFENVPEMEFTLVERSDGSVGDLLETISEALKPRYSGHWQVVEFADYGVPQRRQRLITVFSRVEPMRDILARGGSVLPPPTHSATPSMFTQPWISVEDALAGVPPLDAGCESSASHPSIPLHRVPTLDEEKYFWVSNTPPGRGAFDNQCVNSSCRFAGNPTHGSSHDERGINRSNRDTPIRCVRCGELLPRPWVVEANGHRLMAGFTSAYKRMRGDLPASALTRNLSYACSDQKLHPRQHRVLSLHEALILHTVSRYEFRWQRDDTRVVSDKTIREIIGESIPPYGLEVLFRGILSYLSPASHCSAPGLASAPAAGVGL